MKKKPTFRGVVGFQTPSSRKARPSTPALTVRVVSTEAGEITITAVFRSSSADHARPLTKTILTRIEKAVRSAVLGQLKLAHASNTAHGVHVEFASRSDEAPRRISAKRAAAKAGAMRVSSTRPPPPPKR